MFRTVLIALTAALLFAVGTADGVVRPVVQPGQSWDAAYDAAACGDVIPLAHGSWPAQTLTGSSTRCAGNPITFRPVNDSAVATVGCRAGGESCVITNASNIIFDGGVNRGIRTQSYTANGAPYQGRWDTERGTNNLTFTNLDIGAITVATNGMTVSNSDLGPSVDPLNIKFVDEARNVLFENNLVHDYVIARGGHMECIAFWGGHGVTWRNNTIRNCAVFHMWIVAEGSQVIENIIVEGNTFEPNAPGNGSSMVFKIGDHGGFLNNVVVRNNRVETVSLRLQMEGGFARGDITVTGNVVDSPPGAAGCMQPGITVSTPHPGVTYRCGDNRLVGDDDPPPPPDGCDAACEQAYKDQIAALQEQVADRDAEIGALQAKLAQIHALSAP